MSLWRRVKDSIVRVSRDFLISVATFVKEFWPVLAFASLPILLLFLATR